VSDLNTRWIKTTILIVLALVIQAPPVISLPQDLLNKPTIGFSNMFEDKKENILGRQFVPREVIPLESSIDPADYLLGPHDEVTVGIWDEISFSIPVDVTPEGTIILSPAGLIDVKGLTVREAEDKVRGALRSYYPNVEVTLTLTGIRSIKVHIAGEVYYPGSYEVTPVDRVFDIIQMSGGFLPGGSSRNISVKKLGTGESKTIDLESFLQDGDIKGNPHLEEDNLIYVPPKSNMILVRGEVNGRVSPGLLEQRKTKAKEDEFLDGPMEIFLEFREGDLLSEAIKRAGGLKETADFQGGMIHRLDPASSDSIITVEVDLYALFVLGDLSADVELQKGDIIEVPMDARRVYVIGFVENPGPFPFHSNLTAYEFVGIAGGPSDDGSMGGWKIIDTEGERRKARHDDIVGPGETVYVPERLLTKLGKVLTPVSAVSTIIISIVALQK
jgi:protein involved in polysaccharide export with SLBB domain